MNRASANSPAPSPLGLDVLVLQPDGRIAAEIVSALAEATPEARVAVASSLGEAQHLVIEQKPALFVLDVDASYDMAQEFIYDLRTSHPNARAIILTAIHFSAQRDQVAGLGAIHFLEKPFPRADFIVLVEALLTPASQRRGETFQGTLSDLHIADIIQLKCIGGATSMLEFTGPEGEKARVYFENGQVRHAMAGAKEGLIAFNEIVDWKGGMIHEVPVPSETPRTIDLNWQVLLMEAVRTIDESREQEGEVTTNRAPASDANQTILVVDDSLMLLSFLKEILEEQQYRVLTAPTASEGLAMARNATPDLILLDFVLPDMQGDEVCRNLMKNSATATIPVAYVSGLGSDLRPNKSELPNIIGSLSKPFTSDTLIKTVRSYLAGESAPNDGPYAACSETRPASEPVTSRRSSNEPILRENSLDEKMETRKLPIVTAVDSVAVDGATGSDFLKTSESPNGVGAAPDSCWEEATITASATAYFSGDSSFFPLHLALRTINGKKLTGIFRASWAKRSLDLLARGGEIVLVTTRKPGLYCEKTPTALLHVERPRIEAARARQERDGCPIFVSLADEGLFPREPALDQIQHYGQKLFSQLWTAPVRFVFEERELPHYARDLYAPEANIDQWALNTLRFVQFPHLGTKELCDSSLVPAYTCTGQHRLQELTLADAEAQFASQINGARSIAQISKSLRLDTKVMRLTLFRFLALEVVQCWPARSTLKLETRGRRRRLFSR